MHVSVDLVLLTEISESPSGREGKVEWSDKSEHSPLDRVACEPDSQPGPPSHSQCPSSSAHQFTHLK